MYRHGRACPGHPRLAAGAARSHVDARIKSAHDAITLNQTGERSESGSGSRSEPLFDKVMHLAGCELRSRCTGTNEEALDRAVFDKHG
jgi:hypothetical protein